MSFSHCVKLILYFLTLQLASVVLHDSASKECKRQLAEAYALNKELNGLVSDEDLHRLRRKLEEDQNHDIKAKRQRQKLIG